MNKEEWRAARDRWARENGNARILALAKSGHHEEADKEFARARLERALKACKMNLADVDGGTLDWQTVPSEDALTTADCIRKVLPSGYRIKHMVLADRRGVEYIPVVSVLPTVREQTYYVRVA